MQDAMHLSFNIPCPENILWWAICIAFIGSLITGVLMRQASRFTINHSGEPILLQKFHRIGNAGKAQDILNNMSRNARNSMRVGLNIDFCFMPFFYGLMICLSILIFRDATNTPSWNEILQVLCWLPLGIWLFDLLENSATLSILKRFEKKREVVGSAALLMTTGSWLKWISGLVWLLLMISHAVAKGVEYWG